MKRIGIMGGTFNPIHNVHLIMAQTALNQFQLDHILFMPAKNPPHKKQEEIIQEAHRIRMIQLAIDGNERFELSDMECRRDGKTYTSDTLLQLKKENPNTLFYFIIGGDSLMQLEEWHKPQIIFENCHLIAARRGQITRKEFRKKMESYEEKYKAEISALDMENIHISSERIRSHIKKKEPFAYYCPDAVTKYILYHGLYGCVKEKKEELSMPEIHSILEGISRPHRFLHMIGVQYISSALAMTHGVIVKQAELAGILHDCAKYLTIDEQRKLCGEYAIELTGTEKENPCLIHGKLGAEIAKSKFGVSDEEVLSAIRYHITGRPNMTSLEKIIFIADYIEPGRKERYQPHLLGSIRHMAFVNLDTALLMCLENILSFLSGSQEAVDSNTEETYQFYKNQSFSRNQEDI